MFSDLAVRAEVCLDQRLGHCWKICTVDMLGRCVSHESDDGRRPPGWRVRTVHRISSTVVRKLDHRVLESVYGFGAVAGFARTPPGTAPASPARGPLSVLVLYKEMPRIL